jgi:hypothetical protein
MLKWFAMTDQDEVLADAGPEPAQVAKLDLSKYGTAELVGGLTELISVPRMFLRIVKFAGLIGLLAFVACCLIFAYSEVSLVPWLTVCAYSLVVGVLLGVILGFLRVIAHAILNIESVLRIGLQITGEAATDYEQLQSGEMQLPSGGELVEQVFSEVVSPALEKAVARAFGILGKPLLWFYRLTVRSSVRYMLKRVRRRIVSDEKQQVLTDGALSGLGTLAKYSDTITAFTSSALKIVTKTGRTIRFWVMFPLYALFTAALLLATLPILLVRYFAAG